MLKMYINRCQAKNNQLQSLLFKISNTSGILHNQEQATQELLEFSSYF